jgi:hypothetical protein
MTTSNLIYLPQREEGPPAVLAQFLPRLPYGVASDWLANTLPQRGQWIVDPFGASPQLALDAARAGYRVLLISNNPITRFVLDLLANPPSSQAMQAALADLATAKRGQDRMEQHIRDLYTTTCSHCSAQVDAQYFLWTSETLLPYARVYACPNCHQAGEFPVTDEDLHKANRFSHNPQQQARALQRVASRDDPNRFHAEEALDAHLPRAIYALITMINKLDGIDLEAQETKYLQALLLAACDKGNNLWRIPSEYTRPRQLITPPRFIEHNLWLALEDAVGIWASGEEPVPLTDWPESPPESGGICLYQGSLKALASRLDTIPVGAVISALPRPNQAFWTLSALWAGWLWGRDAIGPFARVLQRRRYDWGWHTAALTRTLHQLARILPARTPFFGMVTENEAGFDAAALAAADLCGFVLEGITLRQKERQTQLVWRKAEKLPESGQGSAQAAASQAVEALIAARGEPTPYLHLQAAALYALSQKNLMKAPGEPAEKSPASQAAGTYTHIRQLMVDLLAPTGRLVRYQGGKSSIEIGKWWPKNPAGGTPALADQVETAIVQQLQNAGETGYFELDSLLCAQFPGLLTPDQPLVSTILTSYAEKRGDGRYFLKENDSTAKRRTDIAEIAGLLVELGQRMGYQVRQGNEIVWQQAQGRTDLVFYLIASANLGRILDGAKHPPEQGIIVLPGGRAEVVLFKRERDPRLDQRLKDGWRFLKYRHVRRMAASSTLSPDNMASYLTLDPLTQDATQIPLF